MYGLRLTPNHGHERLTYGLQLRRNHGHERVGLEATVYSLTSRSDAQDRTGYASAHRAGVVNSPGLDYISRKAYEDTHSNACAYVYTHISMQVTHVFLDIHTYIHACKKHLSISIDIHMQLHMYVYIRICMINKKVYKARTNQAHR